jgi:hypothetical protein
MCALLRRIPRGAAAVLAGVLGLAGLALAPGLVAAEEPSKMSAAFERFRFKFFEDPNSARDGLDLASLAELEGEERTRAENMLLDFLPDTRGVIGLGVLRSRRAKPQLIRLFEAERFAQGEAKRIPNSDWFPFGLIDLGRALWLIDPDPRWPAALIDVLASSTDWVERDTAAEALYDVRDPAVVQALVKALDDPEALVRYHAAHGLLAIYGLPDVPKDLENMMYRAMSDDNARREGGKRDILAAIAGRHMLAP